MSIKLTLPAGAGADGVDGGIPADPIIPADGTQNITGGLQVSSIINANGNITSGGNIEAVDIIPSGQILVPSGTPLLPTYSFADDPNTGSYRPAPDVFAISTGGVQAVRWNSSQQTLAPLGTSALPSYTFAGWENTGLYKGVGNRLSIVVSATPVISFTSAQVEISVGGSAATPAISRVGPFNTGIWFPTTTSLAISTAGVEAIRWNDSQQTVIPVGSVTVPSLVIGDTDSGFYSIADNSIGLTTSGTLRLEVSGNAIKAYKAAGSAKVTLTDAGTIVTDASRGNMFKVELGGNRLLANPDNLQDGFTYMWLIQQDNVGTRLLSYGDKFKFPGAVLPALTTTVSGVDTITAAYDGDRDFLLCNFQANYS